MRLALKPRWDSLKPTRGWKEGKDIAGRGNIMNKGRRHKNLPCPGNGQQFEEERKPLLVSVPFFHSVEHGKLETNPDLASLGLALSMQLYPRHCKRTVRDLFFFFKDFIYS